MSVFFFSKLTFLESYYFLIHDLNIIKYHWRSPPRFPFVLLEPIHSILI